MLHSKKIEPKFVIDAMIGNISKKLRLMGFDCLYYSNIIDDELIKLARNDYRVIVSRDKELVRKSQNFGIRSIFLKSNNEIEQLWEILDKLNLKLIEITGNRARCPNCNYKTESIEKENVFDKIPKKVLEYNEKFWICNNCDKIFWEGSHITNLQKLVGKLNERK